MNPELIMLSLANYSNQITKNLPADPKSHTHGYENPMNNPSV
jgi:hypothetical protein